MIRPDAGDRVYKEDVCHTVSCLSTRVERLYIRDEEGDERFRVLRLEHGSVSADEPGWVFFEGVAPIVGLKR